MWSCVYDKFIMTLSVLWFIHSLSNRKRLMTGIWLKENMIFLWWLMVSNTAAWQKITCGRFWVRLAQTAAIATASAALRRHHRRRHLSRVLFWRLLMECQDWMRIYLHSCCGWSRSWFVIGWRDRTQRQRCGEIWKDCLLTAASISLPKYQAEVGRDLRFCAGAAKSLCSDESRAEPCWWSNWLKTRLKWNKSLE